MRTMRTIVLASVVFFALAFSAVFAGPFDLLKDLAIPGAETSQTSLDENTTISGLKEALSIGTQNAVKSVSKSNGYFSNDRIKILLPDKIQTVAEVASKLGYQKQVDELILSMNRAAEGAAPKASRLFGQAIKEMTFDDARGILQGGDTSATEFFKKKTSAKLYDEFKPIVSSSVNKVGVAKAYKEMMAPVETVPFVSKESVDLDHYVTTKALDGLFLMIGDEEKKIRTNPTARVTDLLKTVFGK